MSILITPDPENMCPHATRQQRKHPKERCHHQRSLGVTVVWRIMCHVGQREDQFSDFDIRAERRDRKSDTAPMMEKSEGLREPI